MCGQARDDVVDGLGDGSDGATDASDGPARPADAADMSTSLRPGSPARPVRACRAEAMANDQQDSRQWRSRSPCLGHDGVRYCLGSAGDPPPATPERTPGLGGPAPGRGGAGTRRTALRSSGGSVPSSALAAASLGDAPLRSASSTPAARSGVAPMLTRPTPGPPDVRCRGPRHTRRSPSPGPGGRTSGSPTAAPAVAGTRISVRTSSGASAVSRKPVKKSSAAGISRSPPGPRATKRRPQRQQRRRQVGRRVAVGDRAADRAPVAHLRVADLARDVGQQRHLLAAVRRRWPGRGGGSGRRCATWPPSLRTYDRSSRRPMSMSTAGAASRSRMSGSSEWPPASSLASSPCSPSERHGLIDRVDRAGSRTLRGSCLSLPGLPDRRPHPSPGAPAWPCR